jgi:hypothetical protein
LWFQRKSKKVEALTGKFVPMWQTGIMSISNFNVLTSIDQEINLFRRLLTAYILIMMVNWSSVFLEIKLSVHSFVLRPKPETNIKE